jgi:hypothetical protein
MKTKEQIEEVLKPLIDEINSEGLDGVTGMLKFEKAYTLKWVLDDDYDAEKLDGD